MLVEAGGLCLVGFVGPSEFRSLRDCAVHAAGRPLYLDKSCGSPQLDVIPDDVKRFVLASIPSVPYLEALLWARGHAGDEFGVPQVGRALYLAEADAAPLLEALVDAGVLQRTGGASSPAYRYGPQAAGLSETIDALAEAYSAHLVEIARLIHDATHRNAHRFADAFRLRRNS